MSFRLNYYNIPYFTFWKLDYWVSNSLDPAQARHFVGPDLGTNCLQRLSADKKSLSGNELNTKQLVDTNFWLNLLAYVNFIWLQLFPFG